eukprot:12279829-Ditylum_brightwellii.AAC.1
MSGVVKLSRSHCCRLLVMVHPFTVIIAFSDGNVIGVVSGSKCFGVLVQNLFTSASAITFNWASSNSLSTKVYCLGGLSPKRQ